MASSAPNYAVFFPKAVDAIVKNWTALQLIVYNWAAGKETAEKAEWVPTAIVQWFGENKDLDYYEVTNFLEDIVVTEFNVQVDDGSYREIAKLLIKYDRLCKREMSESRLITELQKLPRCDLTQCMITDAGEVEKASLEVKSVAQISTAMGGLLSMLNEDDEKEKKEKKVEEDPDGWCTVPQKKGRKKPKGEDQG